MHEKLKNNFCPYSFYDKKQIISNQATLNLFSWVM